MRSARCGLAVCAVNGLSPDNPTSITVAIGARGHSTQLIAQSRAVRAGFTVTNAAPGLITIGPYEGNVG